MMTVLVVVIEWRRLFPNPATISLGNLLEIVFGGGGGSSTDGEKEQRVQGGHDNYILKFPEFVGIFP